MFWKRAVLSAVIALPLNQVGEWQLLEFSSLPANKVEFSDNGMLVKVDKSASPIIYPLEKAPTIKSISLDGELYGLLQINAQKQGQKGADDFSLKVGLVVKGNRTLNTFQKMVAAKWIKTLFSLAPEGAGVEKIDFLAAVQDKKLLGKTRQHPLSELLYERNIWVLNKTGKFSLEHEFKNPPQVLAIWLSIDGDDTKSEFSILLKNLRLETLN